MRDIDFERLREDMVVRQIAQRGITDQKVLEVFKKVPRHLFIPENERHLAYEDCPVPIGHEQTISQPYISALMTEALGIKVGDKVLEVGTGSGYQAAILAYLGAEVYSIERIPQLSENAKQVLDSLGCKVKISTGDGTLGWPEYSPYDKIIITAAAPGISNCWIEQLVVSGKIVVPLGQAFGQNLTLLEKIRKDKIEQRVICGCIFVPLIGKYGYK